MRHLITHLSFLTTLVLSGFVCGPLVAKSPCGEVLPLAADGSIHTGHLDTGADAFFEVEVTEPGWLAAEVVVSGLEVNIPWIEILPGACHGLSQPAPAFLQIGAGIRYFCDPWFDLYGLIPALRQGSCGFARPCERR